MVHGVNDVGTSYSAVEEGLCAGLQDRLLRKFKPGTYRMPGEGDKKTLLDDPDAVFFKRDQKADADSPVIPFYWGFREVGNLTKTVNGQKTDRNGNRLDKDLSKEAARLAMPPAPCPICGTRGYLRHSTRPVIHSDLSRTDRGECTWCLLRDAWRRWWQ